MAAVPGDDRITFHWIGPDGTFYREAHVRAPGAAYCEFALSRDGVAVVWASGERWERGLYLTILDEDFEPVSAARSTSVKITAKINVHNARVKGQETGSIENWGSKGISSSANQNGS